MLEKRIAELEEKMKEHEKRIKVLEDISPSLKTRKTISFQDKIGIEIIAKKINVNPEKIKALFDMEDNSLTLLRVVGKGAKEKTRKVSLAVLLGYKHFFNNEQVLSKEIRRNVAENRIPLNNFAAYLNEIIPSLIRRKGKPKSPATTYRLTPLGEAEAREVLKELCEQQNE